MDRCAHGYSTVDDCPRCAPRPVTIVDPARPFVPMTRWHKTQFTYGPMVKCTVTFVLLGALGFSLFALSQAATRPLYTVFVVPFGCLLLISKTLLPELWEKGRR